MEKININKKAFFKALIKKAEHPDCCGNKKSDTYRLVHPDGTEDLFNYNPIEDAKEKAKLWCSECNGEDEASICKWCYQDAIETGRNKEKDIKVSQLTDHYKTGRLDEKKITLEIIDNWLKSYPEDVFLKISDENFKKIHKALINIDIPLDRLSAHIMRKALNNFKEYFKGEIENGKNK